MALLAGGVNLPGVGMAPAANEEPATKVLCLSEVVSAGLSYYYWLLMFIVLPL
jgi:hypothetical protein